MRELSLHILDIVQNSLRAHASEVRIEIIISTIRDELIIEIADNGDGMSEQMSQDVLDPFTTTRKTRRVGLGLPLFQAAAERSDGELTIKSAEGQGTIVRASFKYSHIDRTPLGDIVSTIITLIHGNPEVDFVYHYEYNNKQYDLSTELIKQELPGVSVNHPLVLEFIKNDLEAGLKEILVD